MKRLEKPDHFEDPNSLPSNDVLQQIGRLALLTASIEDIIHFIIWKYLRVKQATGKAITGERKLGKLQEVAILYLKTQNAPKNIVEDMEDIFGRLSLSAQMRNRCVHWIWETEIKDGKYRLRPPGAHKSTEPCYYSAKEIQDVGDELVWLEARLYAHSLSTANLYRHIRRYKEAAVVPWLYIFPQPNRDPK